MQVETEQGSGGVAGGNPKSLLATNTGSFLTFTVLFIVLFQFYNKGDSNRKKNKKTEDISNEETEYLGIQDLPKCKNVVPFKLIGCLPRFLPFSRTLKEAEKMVKECGELNVVEGLMQEFVLFNSAPALQALLKSTDLDHLIKLPILYRPFAPFVENGVLVSTGTFWQRQRKILMKSQSYQNLKFYMSMLNRHGRNLVENLKVMFEDEKPHQINALINTTFLDVITEMITGKAMDRSDELIRYHHNFTIWKDTVVRRVFNPLLLLKPIWFFHPKYTAHAKAEKELMEFAKKRLEEHREFRAAKAQNGVAEKNVDKPAFRCILDELLDAGGMDDNQIVQEVNVMMFGGHETGASTIHCLLYALALNPEIQELARKDADELFDNSINLKDGNLTLDAVQSNLKYVERCIFEALRLFPPVFVVGRQIQKPLKFDYKGKTVLLPAGTKIGIVPYLLHRMEQYYPEPHKFDPDRFLPEETAKRHAYSYIPFSAGTRNCLGLKFAMVELKLVVAYVLRHFELQTEDKYEDVVFMPYTTLTPLKDFTFKLKERVN